jgi:hypothetical protein
VAVSFSSLNQTFAAGRKIEDQLRTTDRQRPMVNNVDVGPITGLDETTIE